MTTPKTIDELDREFEAAFRRWAKAQVEVDEALERIRSAQLTLYSMGLALREARMHYDGKLREEAK